MDKELTGIPSHAMECYAQNKGLILPENVPYIGMGSSYYAALILRYQGKNIYPEIASEYFNYLEKVKQFDKAVLISQSGESSETFWCAERFEKIVAIVNDADSFLAKHQGADIVVNIHAGEEKSSSTKTFINTLIVLLLGHGIDPLPAIDSLDKRLPQFKKLGKYWGKDVCRLLKKKKYKGYYIIGAGPNVGTAQQAALVLAETTKLPFFGMSLAQYDHGAKEAAGKSVVFVINPKGEQAERTVRLIQKIKDAGGVCFELLETELPENLSPIVTCIPFFFMAEYLQKKLKIKKTFSVGDKVTRVTS